MNLAPVQGLVERVQGCRLWGTGYGVGLDCCRMSGEARRQAEVALVYDQVLLPDPEACFNPCTNVLEMLGCRFVKSGHKGSRVQGEWVHRERGAGRVGGVQGEWVHR